MTGAICQPKFQRDARGIGPDCTAVTDGHVLRHLVLHGLVGADLTAAYERQGLTLVHLSAQRKHFLLDALGSFSDKNSSG